LKEFFRGQDMSETFWPMFTLLTFLIGMQFLILGFISDMLMKTYYGRTGRRLTRFVTFLKMLRRLEA